MATRCFSPPESFAGRRSSRRRYAEQIRDLVELAVALGLRREPAAVEQVLPHGEMREQAPVLEHVADAPLVHRHEDAALGVDHRDVVHDDAALVGPDQAGDDVDQRGLAGARAAEQRGEPAVGREARIEAEAPQPMLDVDGERHASVLIAKFVYICGTLGTNFAI